MKNQIVLLLLFQSVISYGQDIKFQNLFEGGKGGYYTYRIPGLVATGNGTLIAWCEARKTSGDWAEIDILARRSTDGGATWSESIVLVDEQNVQENTEVTANASRISGDTQGATVNNPVMIWDAHKNRLHFIYCIEYRQAFYSYSDNEGLSFSEPVEITNAFEEFKKDYPFKVLATGPGHGIQHSSGRLIIPVWLSTGEFENGHRPSVVSTLYSNDYGNTWQIGDIAVDHQKTIIYSENQVQAVSDPNETVAVELADGRVMLNSRSESPEHRRVVTISPNGYSDWSDPRFHPELFDPVCMASMIRYSKKPEEMGNVLLFANPNTIDDPKRFGKVARARENLTIRMSHDEGETWPVIKVIEKGISAYSDMAVDKDKNIYLLFEKGGIDGNQYQSKYLTLARFNLAHIISK